MDGVDTDYVLDPVGLAQVLMEGTGGESIHYLPGLGQYSDAAWRYYLPDRLGSIRHLVDPAGAVLRSQSYDPFGNLLQQGGSGQSAFGYTGEQADPTGLVYLRARYYDPSVGRFLTADSLIPDPLSSGGWNRYAYVENNPVRFVDPSGHQGGECVQLGLQDPAMCIPQGGGARGGLGSSSSSGGLGRGAIIRAGIGGAVIGGTAAAVNNMVLDPEIPPLPPGMDLNETPIIPCFEPGIGLGGVGDILPPVLSTPLDSSSFPIFFGTPLSPGIEWPNFLTIERLKTYYGEVIEVRKLSAREVRELGLHEEKKSTKGSKAKDDIYVEPKTGRYWIRRGGGPLIEL